MRAGASLVVCIEGDYVFVGFLSSVMLAELTLLMHPLSHQLGSVTVLGNYFGALLTSIAQVDGISLKTCLLDARRTLTHWALSVTEWDLFHNELCDR